MATITLKTQMAGPTDNAGTCRVLYEVTNADGIAPEIFVVKCYAPAYQGADRREEWQHVAYADEMTKLPTEPEAKLTSLYRKAAVTVQYNSLVAAKTAINSIRSQIQRLVNEINILAEYTATNTWVISSIE